MTHAAEIRSEIAAETAVAIGSAEHKELFCHMLLDTFIPYDPAAIAWPALDSAEQTRLQALPFWDIALSTETNAARSMEALAAVTDDSLIREAVALNAREERRHKEVIRHLLHTYGIGVGEEPHPPPLGEARWAFLRIGYGECFDSFFAFGLFALGRTAGFLPEALVEVFEPVIQEEARHNLFFVNWVAYSRTNRPMLQRPLFAGQCLAAMLVQVAKRLGTASEVDGSNFTRSGASAMAVDLAPRDFLALCVAEQERRMARYDRRLLRPRLMPWAAQLALRFLPERKR